MLEVLSFAAISAILVWATWILHSALRSQNTLLQQELLMRDAQLKDAQLRYAALERDKNFVEGQLATETSRADDLQQCFARIGINGKSLESMRLNDVFWRDSALQLVRSSIDEAAIDSSRDDKTNASIVAVAKQLLNGGAAATCGGAATC